MLPGMLDQPVSQVAHTVEPWSASVHGLIHPLVALGLDDVRAVLHTLFHVGHQVRHPHCQTQSCHPLHLHHLSLLRYPPRRGGWTFSPSDAPPRQAFPQFTVHWDSGTPGHPRGFILRRNLAPVMQYSQLRHAKLVLYSWGRNHRELGLSDSAHRYWL